MKNRKNWLRMAAFMLVFGLLVVGCLSSPRAPNTFVKGSAGDTTILLREGLDFDRAFREVAFVLNRHGFETEMIQPEVGFIRTRWQRWGNQGLEVYRVRIICNFNPARTQLIVRAEAEHNVGGQWVQGYDSRAIETLRNDLNMSVGN